MKITIETDDSGATSRIATGAGGVAPAASSSGGSDGNTAIPPSQFDAAPPGAPAVSGSARNGGPAPSAPGGMHNSAPAPFMMAGAGDLQGAVSSPDQAAGAAPGAAQSVDTFTVQQEPPGGGDA